MFSKLAVFFMAAIFLCLMITSAQATPDQDKLAAMWDKQDLDNDNRQLLLDQKNDIGSVPADQGNINIATRKFQADVSQILNDDGLEINQDQQAVNNGYQQLLQDQSSNFNSVPLDQGTLNSAEYNLQAAQLKLQADRNLDQNR